MYIFILVEIFLQGSTATFIPLNFVFLSSRWLRISSYIRPIKNWFILFRLYLKESFHHADPAYRSYDVIINDDPIFDKSSRYSYLNLIIYSRRSITAELFDAVLTLEEMWLENYWWAFAVNTNSASKLYELYGLISYLYAEWKGRRVKANNHKVSCKVRAFFWAIVRNFI